MVARDSLLLFPLGPDLNFTLLTGEPMGDGRKGEGGGGVGGKEGETSCTL